MNEFLDQAYSFYRGYDLNVCKCPAYRDHPQLNKKRRWLVWLTFGLKLSPSVVCKHFSLLPPHNTTISG